MNPNTHSTAAAPMPAQVKIEVDTGALARLTPSELKSLGSVTNTLLNVASGLVSQPRFAKQDRNLNDAGLFMECVCEGLGGMIEAILDAAQAVPAKSVRDVEERAWCILDIKTTWNDSLGDLAVIASQAVADERDAYFHALWEANRK